MKRILLFVSLCVGHFLVDFMVGIFAVHKTLACMDLALAGGVCFVGAFVGESSQLFFGALGDRGYRKLLVVIGVVLCVGNACLGYASHSLAVMSLLLCTYLGSAAFHPAAAALVGGLSCKNKAFFLSLFASCGSCGLAASQVVYYHVYQAGDGTAAILALPALVVAAGMFWMFKGIHSPATAKRSESLFAAMRLFKVQPLRRLYLALVCHQTLFWSTVFLLPDILLSRGCPDWVTYGGGHLAFVLGGALMMLPCGLWADRKSPRQVIVSAMGASVVLLYLFLMFPITAPTQVLLFLVALGACLGVVNPVGVAFGQRLLPDQPGLVSAYVMGMVWCVAESLGPAGSILTKFFEPQNAAAMALMVLSLLNCAGVVAAYLLPRCHRSVVVSQTAS